MNATPLYVRKDDGTFVPSEVVFYCGKCRYVVPHKDIAEQCCVCTICGKPIEEGEAWYGGHTLKQHQTCHHRQDAQHYAEALEKAEVVDGWDGYVFDADSNRIFVSVEEFVEHLEDLDDNPMHCWPDRVFLCKDEHPDRRGIVDLDSLIEHMLEQWGYEDQDERDFVQNTLKGYDAFAAAVDAFNAANTGLALIIPDMKRCMLVPKEEVAARYAAMDAGTPGDEAVCAICRESGNTPERCTATHCHYYESEGATE